jgi:hypothetical protein
LSTAFPNQTFQATFEHIEGEFPLDYENLGEKKVKKFGKPLDVCWVLMEPEDSAQA